MVVDYRFDVFIDGVRDHNEDVPLVQEVLGLFVPFGKLFGVSVHFFQRFNHLLYDFKFKNIAFVVFLNIGDRRHNGNDFLDIFKVFALIIGVFLGLVDESLDVRECGSYVFLDGLTLHGVGLFGVSFGDKRCGVRGAPDWYQFLVLVQKLDIYYDLAGFVDFVSN